MIQCKDVDKNAYQADLVWFSNLVALCKNFYPKDLLRSVWEGAGLNTHKCFAQSRETWKIKTLHGNQPLMEKTKMEINM